MLQQESPWTLGYKDESSASSALAVQVQHYMTTEKITASTNNCHNNSYLHRGTQTVAIELFIDSP